MKFAHVALGTEYLARIQSSSRELRDRRTCLLGRNNHKLGVTGRTLAMKQIGEGDTLLFQCEFSPPRSGRSRSLKPPAALTMQMLDTNSPEDMTLREKFRAVVYLFFPETHPDTQPANVVKNRLTEVLHFDRHGVRAADLAELKDRVRRVAERFVEMYPEDIYGTKMQPKIRLKYDSELRRHVCTVTFRVVRVKPSVVKRDADEEESQFWMDQEVMEELGNFASNEWLNEESNQQDGVRRTPYDNGEKWDWDDQYESP
mmetsp:Transcript_15858/g.30381  ORF Transcript_15858/g.30381 Transcript_15858/m.30381 type:complete len:258 (-) Transcript_15858:517-1290(-)|eukprot:CAMPEP_0114228230 /NCGR_PEP_ID=MMETSP0058-20121206/2226_1 /TAXON_ID=36894 /ORGANISM="Pyramimonas parkeae, CCMP726" /LENGTH=257 /DNA_ID=CAMNT_0001339151 /DNA_START=101 /DNA_END=874 /DNA_ORIENTATION=+